MAAVAAAAAPKPRAGIRAILANHQNANGLFVAPVPVTVSGSLLWDGEHHSPNTVGPEGLQPAKAWEIHPIKQTGGTLNPGALHPAMQSGRGKKCDSNAGFRTGVKILFAEELTCNLPTWQT
jgi:hypothetical protein